MKASFYHRVLHFKQPVTTSRGVYTTHRSYYIVIECKDGEKGIGECSMLPDLSCDAMPWQQYEALLAKVCHEIEATHTMPFNFVVPYPSLLFGLETAFAQLRAGSTALSSTPFARGEEGITINGLVWMGTFEEMYQRLEEKLKAGFRCVKLKIGAIDFDRELELIRHIRECFGKDQVELRLDANGGFTPENAMQRLEALARYDIHSIEQPIKQHQWKEMARLCEDSPVPIALDEELIGVNQFDEKARLLDEIHPEYLVLKPSLHGGMGGTRDWRNLARVRGIKSWMTSALESNVGLNAIAHLCAWLYGPNITMPQGLGTGQLYTDNVDMPLEIHGDKLWYKDKGK